MKRLNYFILAVLFFIVGCSATNAQPSPTLTDEEASWAYEFVKVNGTSYAITAKEVDLAEVGELLGKVKRNIVDMDTDPNLTETDFDSNSLNPGTELYTYKNNQQAILYKISNKYYLATQRN